MIIFDAAFNFHIAPDSIELSQHIQHWGGLGLEQKFKIWVNQNYSDTMPKGLFTYYVSHRRRRGGGGGWGGYGKC